MSALEKYEQMRRATEATQASAAPITPGQQRQRILETSGTRKAMEEMLGAMSSQPYTRLVEEIDGTIHAHFGPSETDYSSVSVAVDLPSGSVHIAGLRPEGGYSENPWISQHQWQTDPERVETEVAAAFLRPTEHNIQPPKPRPTPTPQPPPEKPRGILGRLIFGKDRERLSEVNPDQTGHPSWMDIHER